MDDLIYWSAASLARAIRSREISSKEVVEVYLRQIEDVNPLLNAVVQLTGDVAVDRARAADAALARGEIMGPLHGVPVTIKDSLDTAGIISTGGTKGRNAFVPAKDSTVVSRLLGAGAILLGKTNTPELTFSFETENLIYGRTNNPYDPGRTPGGSSGGAAAIIAAGGSPLDLGSDTGGSIRLPAHFCGIAGIKPTSGRVPRTGHIIPSGGLLDSFTQIGPMARFIEDLILTLQIISGVDWRDAAIVPMPLKDPGEVDLKRLSVAFYTDNGILPATPETVDAVRKTANVLVDAGLVVTEDCPEGIEQTHDIFSGIFRADGGAWVRRLLKKAGTTEVHPFLKWYHDKKDADAMSLAEFNSLMEKWDIFRSVMLSFMERYDVIISPVNAYPAMHHGDTTDDYKRLGFSYTKIYNLIGYPAVVLRAGTSPEGLPIGVQVAARPWQEDVALAVARHIEKVLGGWQPPAIPHVPCILEDFMDVS